MKGLISISVILLLILTTGIFAMPKAGLIADKNSKILYTPFSKFYKITRLNNNDLINTEKLKKYDLLLIEKKELPLDSQVSINNFLKSGKDIFVINAPLWQTQLIKDEKGNFVDKNIFIEKTLENPSDNILVQFSKDTNVLDWNHGASSADGETTIEVIPNLYKGKKDALKVTLQRYTGFDTYGYNKFTQAFKNGANVTEIVARTNNSGTSQLSFEWVEEDGSRWIAVFPLSKDWKRIILKPEDFKYWQSNPKRGFENDKFNPAKAISFAVGLSNTHTATIIGGKREYEIAEVGTSKYNKRHDLLYSQKTNLLAFDNLYPEYKFFESKSFYQVRANREQRIIDTKTKLPVPKSLFVSVQRPQAHGYDKNRDWRFINLIEAYDKNGDFRGPIASMIIHAKGDYKNSVWTSFSVKDLNWYKSATVQAQIKNIAKSMSQEIFFLDAGTDNYTYFNNQPVKIGANIVNLSKNIKKVNLTTYIKRDSKYIYKKNNSIILKPGITKTETIKDINIFNNGTITCYLSVNGKTIDNLSHTIRIWTPKEKKNFVTIKDGKYYLEGKIWQSHGINYMPSSGAASEDFSLFGDYIQRKSYDPEIIRRDIKKLKELNFNSVSIFIFKDFIKDQNLLDLLCILDEFGMKADLSLRPGTPMDKIAWDSAKPIIEYYKLWDNDVVFAYDVAWEPFFGGQTYRIYLDKDWERWVINQYGSIEAAEADWQYPIPRNSNGEVTNPPDELLIETGKSEKLILAYRRFLDSLLYSRYNETRRLIKEIDPNHYVSFRMLEASNPTLYGGWINYDFAYLANSIDIFSPEAYSRTGSWERIKAGIFMRAYGKWADQSKPFAWKEMGWSIWDNTVNKITKENDLIAAENYSNFYKLLIESKANGIYFWYSCPGFRPYENSDYGIFNLDYSDREITKVIRKEGPKFLNAQKEDKKQPVAIKMQTDKYPKGLSSVYDEVKDAFWTAYDSGKNPLLISQNTYQNSDTVSLENLSGKENGIGPKRNIDGGFDYAEITNGNHLQRITDNSNIQIISNGNYEINATVRNLCETIWLANGNKKISIVLKSNNNIIAQEYISKDTEKTETEQIKLQLPKLNDGNYSLGFMIDNIPFGDIISFKVSL